MKACEIIYDALFRLGKGDEYECDKLDIENEEIKKLFFMLNHILSEVSEICRIKTSEKVPIIDGKIDYKQLSKKLYKTINVTVNGSPIPFKEGCDSIKTEMNSGECVVEYYIRLTANGLDENVELPQSIDSSVITLGIASEYNMSRFLVNEALVYEQKYKEALARATFQPKRVIIKTSRW